MRTTHHTTHKVHDSHARGLVLGGLLATAALGSACGADPQGEGTAGSALSASAAAPGPLDGVWALQLHLSENVNMPLVGQNLTSMTVVGRATVQQLAPTTADLSLEFCQVQATSSAALKISFPPAFVKGFNVVKTTASASAIQVGANVTTAPTVVIAGWKPVDPETDVLPTSPTDPRVVDGDGDGQPGLTANTNLFNSDAYLVVRQKTQFNGKIVSLNEIDGAPTGLVEMSVLGSSTGLLPAGALPVSTSTTPPSYRLVRVTGPANSCSDILANLPGIFH